MASIIFTDIDGTLLHDDLTLGSRTFEALRKADEKGIIIGLSSGRYLASLFNIERMLPCKVMKIAVNGALIEYNGSFLQDIRISDKAYRMCASFLRGRCSSLMGFTSRRYAIDADDEWFAIQAAMMKQEGVRMDITDPDAIEMAIGERPCQLLAKDRDAEKLVRFGKELKEMLGDEADVVSSSTMTLEVLPHGVNKGKAIAAISEKLSIPLSDMVAFGDWDNDIGMLRTAGTGICMANGSEEAKAAADFVTLSNNEDGIAYALEKLGII